MDRTGRMFEIVQLMREARGPVTAARLAGALEVSARTIYRDMIALQAARVPVRGEAGTGYVLEPGFDFVPLALTRAELEAAALGLRLLGRTGDAALARAAEGVLAKIAATQGGPDPRDLPLHVSAWHALPGDGASPEAIRAAIRTETALELDYRDGAGRESRRRVRPVALIYYVEAVVLAAWCEARGAFRHFRLDRTARAAPVGRFPGQGARLHAAWRGLRGSTGPSRPSP